MYINRIHIANVRSLTELDWRIPAGSEPGWHVVIGDNGSGKSTFLRAVALALIGPTEAIALRQNWDEWLNRQATEGYIQLEISHDKTFDKFSVGRSVNKKILPVGLYFSHQEDTGHVEIKEKSDKEKRDLEPDPQRHVWGRSPGWFSVAYGPFRRFTGGDVNYDRLFLSNPRLAAHLSVFGEDVALTESLRWLQNLRLKQLEKKPEGNILNLIREFINQDHFLPHQAYLQDVSSNGVVFVDGNGSQVPVDEMSDGYRSILSMVFELIRQLVVVYGADRVFSDDGVSIASPGVVLIDEIDVHLHPTWQREIGLWLCKHFPKIQFIVTTHSPLICQAAAKGTIWRLSKPGSAESSGIIEGVMRDRLIFGNVLDAYGTEVFGAGVTRSDEARKKLQRLAELNQKELFSELTEDEAAEQQSLRTTMQTSANIRKSA